MGAECVRMSPKQSRNLHAERMDTIQSQLRRCEQNLHFTLIIEHIKLTNMTNVRPIQIQRVKQIKFKLKNQFEITYGVQDFVVQEKLIKSDRTQKIQFEFPANKLDSKKMTVEIIDYENKVIEALKVKLLHLCTGPVHHDHLLKQLKARMMFDMYIYQNIEMEAICDDLKIQMLGDTRLKKDAFFYRFSLITQMSENNIESEGGYQDEDGIYDSQILTASVPNNILKQADFKIQILAHAFPEYSNIQNQEVITTVFIPYRKIQNFEKFTSLTKSGIDYTYKKMRIEELFKRDGVEAGKISMNICVESSILYAQQMQGLIFSQIGVNSVSPTTLQSNEGLIKQLRDIYKSAKRMKSSTPQQRAEMMKGIDEMYIKFQKSNDEIFTSQDQLFERQITLVKLLNQLAGLISEGEDLLNQRLWRIIDYIVHKPELTVRYLSVHSQSEIQNQLYLKYYKFICDVLQKIIASTQTGITFHQLQCIQKFIAFAYFRFPWIQSIMLKAIGKKQDPIISEEKLIQFGASLSCKSPSKSYAYDWESNVFNRIKQSQQFKVMLSNLQSVSKNHPDWDCLLFNRNDEDLFYGLYVEIWSEAQHTLKNLRGKILWEYFPNYGALLSCFLGQMNNSKVTDFSLMFKICSNKLALNQKLLNTFVNLLFPKTYLFEISCVMKCLNLLESYFEVLMLANKKLPHDFHFNFFYTGIKTIFNQNHSYLIVKTLLILYKYYQIFTFDFKKMLNSYLLSKDVFYLLFLHWYSNVRKMFHHIIYYKVLPSQANNPEQGFAKRKSQTQKHYMQEDLPFDRRLNLFIKQIENQSSEVKNMKQSEVRNCQKEYHEKMKLNLKAKIQERKLRNIKKINQKMEEELPVIRKQSLFVGNNELQYSKFRKMSVTDEILSESIDPMYLKYSVVSLKEYSQIKKEQNPNKQIEKLSNLFQQGDIDS